MSTPIERAAEALYDAHGSHWRKMTPAEREPWLLEALAAFESIDPGELARVIGEHAPTDPGRCTCGWHHDWSGRSFRGWIGAYDQHVARALIAHLTKGTNDE